MKVVVLVDEGSRAYDVATTLEVFEDRSTRGLPPTTVRLVGTADRVEAGSVWFRTDARPGSVLGADLGADLVVVPGRHEPMGGLDADVITAVRAAHEAGVPVAGLCTGAFVLAAAGILDDRDCTTHWRWCDELATRHPRAHVVPNVLYAGGEGVWTSAGVAAGADLLLELLRQRAGAAAAAEVARSMVMPAHRPGTQAQFIPPVRSAGRGDLARVQQAMLSDLTRRWTLADLADVAATSERTLSRRFVAETGKTPITWLTRARLAAAQELLETTTLTVEAIAHATGFGSADLFRKHFRGHYGTSPVAHRQAMRTTR